AACRPRGSAEVAPTAAPLLRPRSLPRGRRSRAHARRRLTVRALDTGILLLAVNRWAPEHARASRLLEDFVNGDEPWGLPWTVATEFLERVTHPHAVVRPLRAEEACGFLDLLLASPTVQPLAPTARHVAALREVAAMVAHEPGLPPRIETAALLREHGVRE